MVMVVVVGVDVLTLAHGLAGSPQHSMTLCSRTVRTAHPQLAPPASQPVRLTHTQREGVYQYSVQDSKAGSEPFEILS